MLKTLVMDFLAFKPEFSRRLSRIFFSASSRLSRNFRGRLAGLAQIEAAGRLSRRLRGLVRKYIRRHKPQNLIRKLCVGCVTFSSHNQNWCEHWLPGPASIDE